MGKLDIEVKNLDFTYPNGFKALKNINFSVGENEIVGIIGQNGAGKSTLLKNLTGLLKPTNGEVIINGINTRDISIAKLATNIGFVLQNPDRQLFANTVEEEVSYGPRNLKLGEEEIRKRVKEALEFVDLQEKTQEYPPAMSKGERAKVIFASLLAMKPHIIVLDEPTTGQDSKGCQQIMTIARELYSLGHTVLVVTHNMSLVADYCQRVVVLCKGEILMDGTIDEVFKEEELLRSTFIVPPQITIFGNCIKARIHSNKTFTSVKELGEAVYEAKKY